MAENLAEGVADLKVESKRQAPKLYPDESKFEFITERLAFFDELKQKQDEEFAQKERKAIKITMKDGTNREGIAYQTTPFEICKDISKSLLDKTVISKVNGQLWDLERPLEEDCTLLFLDFDTDEGKMVFWHSTAHVLGEACECHYGAHLCIGPPIDDGFYYEMSIEDGKRSVLQSDFKDLEDVAKKAIKEKQKFERLVVTKENLLKMFAYNKYKQHIINDKIPDGTSTTVYRCGPLIDLCRGPHIPHTGRIKAVKLLKNSASYFLGDAKNDSLQRIYGVSFPDKKLMTDHLKFLEEAAKRDHRKIGQEQDLFIFNDLSPGAVFWLPHGARIYSKLQEHLKQEYRMRGFDEVITPNMYNSKLWEISGHWENYKDDMFVFDVEKDKWALKPMNCPGHALMFKSRDRSYRELPIRFADFGVLHRNEASGALSGLTRVRRFQQDDGHIFCRKDQIKQEIEKCFAFMSSVYGTLGFEFRLELSTRPEKFVGEIEVWDKAEDMLRDALNQSGFSWELNEGDGAFYGPKIDIMISDALRRQFQCATIQLDFQLPIRFGLRFRTNDSPEAQGDHFDTPVMIHRAIYGSFERMIGILTEHFFGKWPFWLSPRQCIVIPVGVKFNAYAQKVRDHFHTLGYHSDVDIGPNTLQKKVRQAQLQQYNLIFVVGDDEEQSNSVNVRKRDDASKQGKTETVSLEVAAEKMKKLAESKSLIDNEF